MSHSEPQPTAPSVARASAARVRAAIRCATLRRERRPDFGLFDQWSWLFPRVVLTALWALASVGLSHPAASAPTPVAATSDICIGPSPASEPIVVVVSTSRIFVNEDPEPVVLLPSREQLAASGLDAKHKRSGPDDLLLVPLERALTRAREAVEARCRRQDREQPMEAVVVMDGTLPYRLLTEVLFTLGQSGIGKHHLMVRSGRKKK